MKKLILAGALMFTVVVPVPASAQPRLEDPIRQQERQQREFDREQREQARDARDREQDRAVDGVQLKRPGPRILVSPISLPSSASAAASALVFHSRRSSEVKRTGSLSIRLAQV
jgi:hypothetical protein